MNETPISKSDAILDQAFGEYLSVLDQNQPLDENSWLDRYPDVADQLKVCLTTIQEVQRMAGPTFAEHSTTTASIDTAKACCGTATNLDTEKTQLNLHIESQLTPGEKFGRYHVERMLGQGAMGSVYLAYDEQLHRNVALKVPKFSGALADESRERFYREARAAATLRSANICPVYDVDEIDGVHYISMAYIDGGTLSEVIRERSLTDPKKIAELIAKLARALQQAHDRGIVHRDLKPGNVLIDSEGEPIVTDFGLARRIDDNAQLTQAGAMVGSPAYMSPEQIEGQPKLIGPATDIYSLGVILYELLTGRLPFQGSIMSVIGQVSRDEPPRPSQVAADITAGSPLETICLRMMAKRPEERFSNMSAVAAELLALAKPHRDPPDHHASLTKPIEKRKRSAIVPWTWVITLSIGLLLAFAGVVVVVTDQGQIEIRSEVDDVRVVVAKNGNEVEILDLKTSTKIHWVPTGEYTLKPVGDDNEIVVENNNFRMTRFGKEIVTIRRTMNAGQTTEAVVENKTVETDFSTRTMYGLKPYWMTRVLFSHDGKQAISTSTEGLIWNLQTGNIIRKLTGHRGDIWGLALSPDGTQLLTSDSDTIRLWDFETGALLKEFAGHEASIWSVAFSHDGQRFASAGEDPKIRIWNVATGELLGEIPTPDVATRSLMFSSDGKYLASGHFKHGESGTLTSAVRIWNAETLALERNLTDSNWNISTVTFSPDATTLAASTFEQDASIRMWDVETGNPIRVIAGHPGSECVVYSPDGRYLVSCAYEESELNVVSDRSVRVWDANTGIEVCRFVGHEAGPLGVAVSPDNRSILSCGKDSSVRLWQLPNPPAINPVSNASRILTTYEVPANRVAFSPDGSRVASGSLGGSVLIHDVNTGQRLTRIRGHRKRVTAINFSADGSRLLTASWDNTIRVWDVEDGKELKKFEGHQGLICSAAWSPDESQIASCTHEGNAGAIWIWDTQTGEVMRRFDEVNFQPFMVAFSPDGTQLLSGAHDGSMRLWDVASGKLLRKYAGHQDWVISVAFSSDGSQAISSSKDKSVRIWDVSSGAEQKRFNHLALVGTAVLSADNQRILSGSSDETIRLWDTTTGVELQRFTGHAGEVVQVAISPNGVLAASSGADGSVRLWDLSPMKVDK